MIYSIFSKGKLLLFVLLVFVSCKEEQHAKITEKGNQQKKIIVDVEQRIQQQLRQLLPFIHQSPQYSKDWIFLVDMRIASGRNRFFVYDVNKKKVLHKGLVTHGSGSVLPDSDSLVFKNIPESLATSLGKYTVGYSYEGTFGKAYKLYGLDRTNNKAFERFIVLHYHACVSDVETMGDICTSYGCPTVSPNFFKKLEHIIDNSQKKILLSIYY